MRLNKIPMLVEIQLLSKLAVMITSKDIFSFLRQNHSITALFCGFRVIYFLLTKFCKLFFMITKGFSSVTIFNPNPKTC